MFLSTSIEFIPNSKESIAQYTFAIILAKFKGSWLLVRHRERLTWELPAGHVEANETVDEAAVRELQEETGALDYDLLPLISYRGWLNGKTVYGKLFSAEIKQLGPLPDSEIAEVKCFDEIPENLTYPEIQPIFIQWFENCLCH